MFFQFYHKSMGKCKKKSLLKKKNTKYIYSAAKIFAPFVSSQRSRSAAAAANRSVQISR